MQEYAPRDPLAEFLAGKITLRKLRVMIEHLPPDSAWHRHRSGPWSGQEWLLWNVESRLRELLVATHNGAAATVGAIVRKQAPMVQAPKLLPTPPRPAHEESDPAVPGPGALERTELSALVHRSRG